MLAAGTCGKQFTVEADVTIAEHPSELPTVIAIRNCVIVNLFRRDIAENFAFPLPLDDFVAVSDGYVVSVSLSRGELRTA